MLETLAAISHWIEGLKGGWPELLGSLAGSAIGLLALVIGALYNARLNRKAEREREINDQFGIIEALLAEISSVKHTLDKAAVDLRQQTQGNVQAFIPDPCPDRGVFEKFLSRIELFDEATIRPISELYAVLDEYCTQVVVRGGGFNQSIKGRGVLVIGNAVSEPVAQMNDSLSQRCGDVISELRSQRIRWGHIVTRKLA
ncbi:hypothetical protein [Agrobacterium tumefaciens]|uniref:hypothetical protein n=1 Tax=Agrobacterium tumefaciens TaxID=358 RepID=UPI0021D21D8F|nr:hypothetical protein [Agrobacterium tumefaciens]